VGGGGVGVLLGAVWVWGWGGVGGGGCCWVGLVVGSPKEILPRRSEGRSSPFFESPFIRTSRSIVQSLCSLSMTPLVFLFHVTRASVYDRHYWLLLYVSRHRAPFSPISRFLLYGEGALFGRSRTPLSAVLRARRMVSPSNFYCVSKRAPPLSLSSQSVSKLTPKPLEFSLLPGSCPVGLW